MRRRLRRSTLVEVLLTIGGYGCRNYRVGHCAQAGRSKDSDFTADAWCDACIANDALNRPKGQESYVPESHFVPEEWYP